MKRKLKPLSTPPETATAESLALSAWYDSQPAVRRLVAIRNAQELRVIVTIEPTPDNDDVSPAWFAHKETWASELRLQTGSPVQLELARNASLDENRASDDDNIVADLHWRDPSIVRPDESF